MQCLQVSFSESTEQDGESIGLGEAKERYLARMPHVVRNPDVRALPNDQW